MTSWKRYFCLRDIEQLKTKWDKDEIKMAYYYSEFQKPFSFKNI